MLETKLQHTILVLSNRRTTLARYTDEIMCVRNLQCLPVNHLYDYNLYCMNPVSKIV